MRHLIYGLLLLSASAVAAEYPAVIDPYASATPPGATVSAGYFTLENKSDQNISITDVYSPAVAKVEIHLSTVVNDVAKMEKQSQVEIPAGKTLKFEHGSYHVMFMELKEPLVENTTVDIVLVTSVGEMLIEMPVKKHGSAMGNAMKDHASDDMTKKDSANSHDSMAMDKQNEDKKNEAEMKETETSDSSNEPVKVVH